MRSLFLYHIQCNVVLTSETIAQSHYLNYNHI